MRQKLQMLLNVFQICRLVVEMVSADFELWENLIHIPYFRGLVPPGAYRFSKYLVGRLIEQGR